jgi:hypothetical protein
VKKTSRKKVTRSMQIAQPEPDTGRRAFADIVTFGTVITVVIFVVFMGGRLYEQNSHADKHACTPKATERVWDPLTDLHIPGDRTKPAPGNNCPYGNPYCTLPHSPRESDPTMNRWLEELRRDQNRKDRRPWLSKDKPVQL